MNNSIRIIGVLIVTVVVGNILFAGGERASIASLSLGRVSVATARGLEAVGTNPANLTLPHREWTYESAWQTVTHDSLIEWFDSVGNIQTQVIPAVHDTLLITKNSPPSVSFAFAPLAFGFNVGTDLLNFDIYEEYFTGVDIDGDGKREPRFLTDEDKNRILEIFPSGVAETHFDLDIRLFGLTIHNTTIGDIALTMTDRVAFNVNLPRDYARLFFFGLDSLGSYYDLTGTAIHGWYLREYALSYARMFPRVWRIKDFSAGVTFKLIHGYGTIITDRYTGSISNPVLPNGGYALNGNLSFRVLRSLSENFSDSGSFSPFPKPAGNGFGVDLGVAGELYRGIRAAVSVTDIGSVTWTENTKETFGDTSVSFTTLTFQSNVDSVKDFVGGKDRATGEFNTPLATALRVGGAVQVDRLPFIKWFPGQLLVSVEYHQGFNSSPGNTTRSRIALGMEYRPVMWFPLRTGMSIGGQDRFNWAAGFGFDFGGFNWNFGTENIGVLTSPSAYDQLSFGTSMTFRIY